MRIDPERLVARGVTFDELFAAIERANLNVRGGTVETAGRQPVVRTVGRAERAVDLATIIVKELPAGSVLLADVAEIVDGYRETSGFLHMNGQPAAGMGVRRQAGANVVDLIAAIDAEIERINRDFEVRNLDLRLDPVYKETTYIEDAMGFVRSNLVTGSALAILSFIRAVSQ